MDRNAYTGSSVYIKALMADLKKVYGAVDEETALYELE